MTRIKNQLEVYKLLPKSNCRQCLLPTCLAFSAAVIKGEKQFVDCPHIALSISESLANKIDTHKSVDDNREVAAEQLKSKVSAIDLLSSAERLGATIVDGKLAIKCLGKDFFVDAKGTITSECHIHPWITIPLLDYIIHGKGGKTSGMWVPFRELKKGAAMGPLFGQRCEKPLKEIADSHPDLFEDLISLFSGDRSTNMFSSDIALILYPLPKIPLLICYWQPEDDIESSLYIFFDSTAEDHISIESIFSLGVGIALMIEKVVLKHRKNEMQNG